MVNIQKVPERIAYLILLFLHQKITPVQHYELDEWVAANDENLELFEELSDVDRMHQLYHFTGDED